MNYYSQIGQDKYYIEEICKYKRKGRFLDVGANDGMTESNTYSLEHHLGWTGVCIESNPCMVPLCIQNRPQSQVIEATVWSSSSILEFEYPGPNGIGKSKLARIANIDYNKDYFVEEFQERKVYETQSTTIDELLGPGNHEFDFMSLDIEGAELEALKGIDWVRTSIGFMTVEWGLRGKYFLEITAYLEAVGYNLHRVNMHDAEYIHPRTAEDLQRCLVPL
jgi:FkbM family methyltransferase